MYFLTEKTADGRWKDIDKSRTFRKLFATVRKLFNDFPPPSELRIWDGPYRFEVGGNFVEINEWEVR